MQLSAVGVLPCVTKTRCGFPMPNYRRNNVPEGSFFFTLVTARRAPLFRDPRARRLPGNMFRRAVLRWPFTINAIVLLPEHQHAIFSTRIRTPPMSVAGSDRKTAYFVRGSFACPRPRHRRTQRTTKKKEPRTK
jgi:REP element-mobilizing transposase RayT